MASNIKTILVQREEDLREVVLMWYPEHVEIFEKCDSSRPC